MLLNLRSLFDHPNSRSSGFFSLGRKKRDHKEQLSEKVSC